MSTRFIPLLATVILVCCVPAAYSADIEFETEHVIVFKDGYYLAAKRGKGVTDERGRITTKQVPDAAVLGSFWAVPAEGELLSMKAGWVESTREATRETRCTGYHEVLQANLGKHCTVTYEGATHKGKIHEVFIQEAEGQATPEVLEGLGWDGAEGATMSATSGRYFVLESIEGHLMLSVDGIANLRIQDMRVTLPRRVEETQREKQLTFQFATPNVEREILLMYFRPGLRWAPSYRVELHAEHEPRKAEVSLQAEIVNAAEDLDEVPISIVVGVPNFRFKNDVSPLVLEAALQGVTQQVDFFNNFGNGAQVLSNAIYSQAPAAARRDAAFADVAAETQLPSELTSAGSEDLFVYSLPALDLAKGERVAARIFTTEVPYRDVYTWELHVQSDNNELTPAAHGEGGSPTRLSKNEVWHQIELSNTSGLPWTTGAALVMQGRQPLAQELLTYTSKGDVVRLPLTIAIDVRGQVATSERGRETSALQFDRNQYARLDRQVDLSICNHKAEAIELEVTMLLGGRIDSVEPEGTVTIDGWRSEDWRNYRGSKAINNSSRASWKLSFEPGEVVETQALYHYFSRH